MKRVVLLCAVVAAGCAQKPTGAVPSGGLPEIIKPLDGAVGSQEILHPGQSSGVTYTLQASYPAPSVLAAVEARAASLGWEPLKEDYFRPASTTSEVHGWSSYRDSSVRPPAAVYVWQSCWRNKDGAFLRYTFRYRSDLVGEAWPPPAPASSTLSVIAEVLEPSIAKVMRESYRQSKAE